jgi:hypothetical protein
VAVIDEGEMRFDIVCVGGKWFATIETVIGDDCELRRSEPFATREEAEAHREKSITAIKASLEKSGKRVTRVRTEIN